MIKRGYGVSRKMTIGMLLALAVAFLSGCSDSEIAHKNTQINQLRSYTAQLESRLKTEVSSNQKIKKELSALRSSNTGLNVSLAKSELLFSQKHKAEIDTERKKIEMEQEEFKKEKEKIEKDAYANAEKTVSNKYIAWLAVAGFIIFGLLIFLFRGHNENNKRASEKDTKIKVLKNTKDELSKGLNELEQEINKLKEKEKYGCTSQVVDKINTYQIKREQALKRKESDNHGN